MKSALSLAMFALATSRVKGSAAVLDTFCSENGCEWSSAPDADGVYTIGNGYTRFELAVPVTLQDSNLYVAGNGYASSYDWSMSDYIIRGDETGTANFYYQTDSLDIFGGNGWRTPGDGFSDQSSEEIQHFVVYHFGFGSNLLWSPPESVTVLSSESEESLSCEALEQEWLAADCACTPDSAECTIKKDAWTNADCAPQTCG